MRKKDPKNKLREKIPYYTKRSTLGVYLTLRGLVILTLVRHAMRFDFESVFLCALTLILLILPGILTRKLQIELPSTLEIIVLLFIFAAEILGEINSFYVRVPNWDTMLHTLNGFFVRGGGLCAGGYAQPERCVFLQTLAGVSGDCRVLLLDDGRCALGIL